MSRTCARSSAAGDNLVAVHGPSVLFAEDSGLELDSARQATLQMDDDPLVAAEAAPLVSL